MRTVFWGLLASTLILVGAALTATATDADEQRAVAQKFITAYFVKDMKSVRECLPGNDAQLFAPYPFTSAPTFATPKVHENQALLEFTATTSDAKLGKKAAILFSKHGDVWSVRQILFYEKIPKLFGLPSKSVTREDRGHEAAVKALGEKFMNYWKAGNSKGMLSIWYDWTKDNPDRLKGLSLSNFTLTNDTTSWKDPYVSYSMKATYRKGILSYSMTARGGLIMVKEDNHWKVRANFFIFGF